VVSIPNTAPSLSVIPDQIVTEGNLLTVTAKATDLDGDALSYSLGAGSPSGMTINATLGVITWTSAKAQVGSYTVTVQALDNGTPNLSAITTFKVTVNKANTAPVLAALADQG